MFVDLFRLEETSQGVVGVLLINDTVTCYTLERPYADNRTNVSCIPLGEYECGLNMSLNMV